MSLNMEEITKVLHFSALSTYTETSFDCTEIKEFLLENPSTDKNLSNNILIEEIKSKFMDKWELAFNDT